MLASFGDAEHTRHGGDRERSLVDAHEPEEPDGNAPGEHCSPSPGMPLHGIVSCKPGRGF